MRRVALLLIALGAASPAMAEVSAEARSALIGDLTEAFGGDAASATVVVDCGLAQLDDAGAAELNAAATPEARDAVMEAHVEIEALVACAEEVLG